MRIQPFLPCPQLSPFVELMWIVRGDVRACEKVLPNGAVELIFNLGSPHAVVDGSGRRLYRESWIAGLQEHPIVIAAVRETNLVGVRFRPGGALPFLEAPLSEHTNGVFETNDLGLTWSAELHERLLEAPTDVARIKALENALLSQLRGPRSVGADVWVESAVAQLGRGVCVAEVARSIGVSSRHLTRRFRLFVGTSPKLFARILRLQRAIRLTTSGTFEWAHVASSCGYSDQAHLNRDFRLLVGHSPTQYMRLRDVNPNHLRVDAVPA